MGYNTRTRKRTGDRLGQQRRRFDRLRERGFVPVGGALKGQYVHQSAIPAVCEICGYPCTVRERVAVDHDHVTGLLRGFLCHACNVGIGHLATIENLEKAIAYLRRAAEDPAALDKRIRDSFIRPNDGKF